jgi:hypothetical protein
LFNNIITNILIDVASLGYGSRLCSSAALLLCAYMLASAWIDFGEQARVRMARRMGTGASE